MGDFTGRTGFGGTAVDNPNRGVGLAENIDKIRLSVDEAESRIAGIIDIARVACLAVSGMQPETDGLEKTGGIAPPPSGAMNRLASSVNQMLRSVEILEKQVASLTRS